MHIRKQNSFPAMSSIRAMAGESGLSPDVAKSLADLKGVFVDFMSSRDHEVSSMAGRIDEIEASIGRMSFGAGGPTNTNVVAQASLFNAMIGTPDAEPNVEQYRAYCTGFNAYIRRGLDGLSADIRGSMSVGSDPAGGYFVPPVLADRIIKRIFELSPIRRLAYGVTTTSDAIEFPKDVNDITTGGWVGETGTRSDTATPDLGLQRISVHEQYACPPITQKLIDDARFDIESWIIEKIANKFARDEAAAFASGNGVAKPTGILKYAADSVTTADATRAWGVLQYVASGAAGAFPTISGSAAADADCLHDVIAALKGAYRANARWMMNRATEAAIKKLKDAEGRWLWQQGLVAGSPSTLLGYPVEIVEDMSDIGADSYSIVFGDFRAAYTVVDRIRITMLRDPYTDKGRVKFYTTMRVGGDVVDFDAIKLLKFAAS